MHALAKKHIVEFLGDVNRDFKINPLTQEEIQAAIEGYSGEILKPYIDPDIKTLYKECVEVLKKHLITH